jgi:hypothetical protein
VLGALVVPRTSLAATGPASQVSGHHLFLKTVRYDGVRLEVPDDWPVIDLGSNSRVCVRFDRHAVYLGRPGTEQLCPLASAGRTEAILISPETAGSKPAVAGRGVLTPVSTAGSAHDGGSMARLVDQSHRVVITVTWYRDPKAILTALGLRSLGHATRATNGHRPEAVHAARARSVTRETTSTSPATPGEVYNGLGFDACTAPSESALAAWGAASPFGAVGIYIGGANMACAQANLNAAWVSTESSAGWHLIPTYVGLQAPTTSCGTCATISASLASAEGTAAAQDAVVQAQALGIGSGNPIYFDMEGYTQTTTTTPTVLAFLEAWTEQLHASGYDSGVYSSAASGITDLVSQVATGYVEPDDIWIADWNGEQTTLDSYVPAADWATSQRLHQFQGAEIDDYGGVSINVDSDYLDGASAAAGSASPVAPPAAAAPSLTITSHVDGSVDLTPRWTGEPGISEFQLLGGDSTSVLTPIETVSSTQKLPIVVHDIFAYFELQALNAGGQVLGTSPAVASPNLVALFSKTAFVSPRGQVGFAVACMNALPCKVRVAIRSGKKLIADAAPESVSRHGGIVHLALSERVRRLLSDAPKHQMPVTLSFANGAGTKSDASVDLVSYRTSGKAPKTSPGTTSTLQILGDAELVSNGWVGEVLVECRASTPCTTALRVTTPSGRVIATGRTPTVGADETAELHFQMTKHGHALLKASTGNQLAARVVVRATLANGTDPSASIAGPAVVVARVELDSY